MTIYSFWLILKHYDIISSPLRSHSPLGLYLPSSTDGCMAVMFISWLFIVHDSKMSWQRCVSSGNHAISMRQCDDACSIVVHHKHDPSELTMTLWVARSSMFSLYSRALLAQHGAYAQSAWCELIFARCSAIGGGRSHLTPRWVLSAIL